MTDMAIDMLKEPKNTATQFFMWLHYMDPHDRYIQHADTPTFGKRARDRYDSEVFFTDKHIGRLLDYMREQPYWENTAIIVSADHGEAFGEHEMYKHAFEVWEVLTRVPLLVYAPGVKARNIDERRSHIDLAPTILDLMGIEEHPDSFQGRSLIDEIFGAKPDNREPILLDLPEDHDNLDRRAVIKDGYKLYVKSHGHTTYLFNLDEDPDEKHDLSKKEPKKLEEMQGVLKEMMAQIEPVAPYGGMKLRSGGTADGPTGPAKDEADEPGDPKNAKP
jgi:arylsulfatase A-like enzyme